MVVGGPKVIRGSYVVLTIALALASPALAQTPADFYRGKTVTLYIGNAAGGTYDLYARTIAKHLGAHLPGNPGVIAQNMPGAASLVAAGHVFNVAPRDGTAIAALASTLPFQPLMDPEAAKKIDPTRINWLPSPAAEGVVMLVRADMPVKTVADMKERDIIMATISPGMLPAVLAATTNATLGTRIKPINGHANLAASMLALERGEVDGYPSIPYDAIDRGYAKQMAAGKYRVLLQFGAHKSPAYPDAPLITDIVADPQDRMLLDLAMGPLKVGYAFMLGPGVPKDRVEALRAAFMATFEDPKFREDAARQTLTIAPVSGEATQEIVRQAYATPPAVIERMRAIYRQGQ